MGQPWLSRSIRKIARNKNRGFLRDTVVKSSGGIYKDFLSWETSIRKENGVGKVPEGPTTHQGAPGVVGAPWCLVGTWVAPAVIFFSNIPKLTENIFAGFLESVYLPYHVPPLFDDSGVFWKVSFMCSSSVMVWIVLLSTFIGILEI